MASTVADIAISIGADVTPLVAGLNKGQAAVAKFGAQADASAGGAMKRFSTAGVLMGTAVAAAAVGLAAMTKRVVENAGELHDLSLKTGVHVSQLQAMSQVAGEAGVSLEQLTGGIRKMQDNIAGLIAGTDAQQQAFGRLGLGIRDLQGLSPDEQFARIAEAIAAIQDPTLKTAAAIDVFGKSGSDLIPMMEGYSAAVAEAAQHQRDLGIALSDTDAQKLDDLGDAAGRLKDTALGLATQFAVTFGPAMSGAVEVLTESMIGLNAAFKDFHDWLTTTDKEGAAIALAEQVQLISDASDGASDMAAKAATNFQALADGKISTALLAQAESLNKSKEALRLGAISAEDYKVQVMAALERISSLLATAGKLNDSDMSGAIDQMKSYAEQIATALGIAIQLKNTTDAISLSGSASGGGGEGLRPDGQPGAPTVGITQPAPVTVNISGTGRSGGGAGGGSSLADDLKALQERLESEAEVEQAAFEAAQKTLEDALAKKLLTQQQYQDELERLQRDHQDRMAEIDSGAYGDSLQKTGAYLGVLADTFASGNEKMQKTARVFGAAEALINAWRAYTQTLADPSLPFFAKFSAAAAVLSAGLRAVSAIKGGGSGGGSSSAPVAASGGAPAPSVPQHVANITLHGDTFSGNSLQELVKQLNEAFRQGYKLNLVTV